MMPNATQPKKLLKSHGVAIIPPLYSAETITSWNELFDSILTKQTGKRKYVNALDIVKLGLVNSIFTRELQSLLFSLIPDAVLYHFHVYEIEGNQTTSHISANNKLNGWHRDVDCKHSLTGDYIQHISLFIYLSDVSNNGGYFEVSDKKYFPPRYGNQDVHYQLIGNAGTCFLFDRKAYHRASPNYSTTPRRVLKLSIQSRKLFNHKQQEPIFVQVRKLVNNSSDEVRQLFGEASVSANSVKSLLEATPPIDSKAASFTPYQNFIRLMRDINFIARRIGAASRLINDKKTPKPKIT